MQSIVALGELAGKVSEKFKKYPQYKVYKIDTDIEDSLDTKRFQKQVSVEAYEEATPDCSEFFADVEEEVLFICTGSEAICGSALAVMSQLQQKKIVCMFLKSDAELMTQLEKAQEHVTYSVLQNYARSGVFERIFLIDMPLVDTIIGDVSILEYEEKQADLIASTYHMTQVFMHTQPIMGRLVPPQDPNRISTLGVTEIGEKEDKWLFSLDKTYEKYYLYAVSSALLEEDKQLLGKIKIQVKERAEENAEVMYGIFTTSYADNFVFCLANTKHVQGEKSS